MKYMLITGFIEVYLIDAVTGNVVFHCDHKRSKGPVHVVHSENWVVVSISHSTYCTTYSVCEIDVLTMWPKDIHKSLLFTKSYLNLN